MEATGTAWMSGQRTVRFAVPFIIILTAMRSAHRLFIGTASAALFPSLDYLPLTRIRSQQKHGELS
jgi:hypothetical protein